jgi:hypothetical protein
MFFESRVSIAYFQHFSDLNYPVSFDEYSQEYTLAMRFLRGFCIC